MLLLTGQAAAAQERPRYLLTWIAEPQADDGAPKLVAKGDVVSRTRLLPRELYATSEELRAPDGRPVLEAGVHLARLESPVFVACTLKPPKMAGAGSVVWAGTVRFMCLVDADGDGKVEGYFRITNDVPDFLYGRGRIPAKLLEIVPARYEKRDPVETKDAPTLFLTYVGPSGPDVERFEVCVGQYGPRYCLSDERPRASSGSGPASFATMGGKFTVHERVGEKSVRISMDAPFEAKPIILY
ncbi:hypothetical protein [Sphingomonas sp. AOB5]|uniref:hypothetical protein n=1 Tax=Sphingomonas sp. AOB5 TaxID=3034017 RepID=UPI0023F8D603|nr:hypothetical protein [Sphingomonas sp. AOB5]